MAQPIGCTTYVCTAVWLSNWLGAGSLPPFGLALQTPGTCLVWWACSPTMGKTQLGDVEVVHRIVVLFEYFKGWGNTGRNF